VTPLQYLQTRRLLLAKQLLTDTRMPVAQIALTSGFRSLRRFNAAFLGGYRMNPTRLRRATPRDATSPPTARDEPARPPRRRPMQSRSRSAIARRSTSRR
jgi:AraC-like DNA-binding protein